MTFKGAFKNSVEPQVRTKGVSKVKSAESDSAIVKTKIQINANQSSKTDPVLPATSTTNIATNTIASTNSADLSITTNDTTATNSDQKKKCRKVVEHTSPGNGHVFNLAKVVAHKPRSVRNEFRPSLEDGEYTSICERNNSDVRKDMNNCVDVLTVDGAVDGRNPAADSEIGAIKQPKQQNNNGERPRRKDLMIREKIRFFNQIDDKPVHTGKTLFLFTDRQS